jgi:hypothetical protein
MSALPADAASINGVQSAEQQLSQLDLVNRSSGPPNISTTNKEGSIEHLM